MFHSLVDPATSSASFAALDLGTNNCRLMVATPARDGFRVLDSFSRIVRLGEGLHASGALSETAMDRTSAALRNCAERLARRRVRNVRAIATEACRRASNGREFLDRVRRETGLAFNVISAREEAELALESCTPLLAPLAETGIRRALLFDIGGGSTELAWVRLAPGAAPVLTGTISLPVGVATLAERQPVPGYAAIVVEVAERLAGFQRTHCTCQEVRQGGVVLLGTSGTVTTLAGIVLDLPRYQRLLVDGVVLAAPDVRRALDHLRGLSPAGLAAMPCVGPGRADFILPGCAVFDAIHGICPTPRIMVADRGLREGILLRLMRSRQTTS